MSGNSSWMTMETLFRPLLATPDRTMEFAVRRLLYAAN